MTIIMYIPSISLGSKLVLNHEELDHTCTCTCRYIHVQCRLIVILYVCLYEVTTTCLLHMT